MSDSFVAGTSKPKPLSVLFAEYVVEDLLLKLIFLVRSSISK